MNRLIENEFHSPTETFQALMSRLGEDHPDIKIRRYDDTEDDPFEQWILKAVKRALLRGSEQPSMYIVSGEFYHTHWNTLGETLKKQEKIEGKYNCIIDCLYDLFQVRGICCPYIDRGEYANAINKVYKNLFHRAAREKRESIRLYCSDIRESCHWICIDDEMHVVDWHEPVFGDTNDSKKRPTYILTGESVSKFAHDEFYRTLERLAGYWALEGDVDLFDTWLYSDDTENLNITGDKNCLVLNAATNEFSFAIPEANEQLPKEYYDLLTGNPAEYRVPYHRIRKGYNRRLFKCMRTSKIRALYDKNDKKLCPPSIRELRKSNPNR